MVDMVIIVWYILMVIMVINVISIVNVLIVINAIMVILGITKCIVKTNAPCGRKKLIKFLIYIKI